MKNYLAFLLLTALFQNLQAAVVTVTDQNFEVEVLQSSLPVVLKTYTNRCGACQEFAPIFRSASNRFSNYKFVELDTVNNPVVREAYKIKTVPTSILFVNGKEVARHSGFLTISKLNDFVNKLN